MPEEMVNLGSGNNWASWIFLQILRLPSSYSMVGWTWNSDLLTNMPTHWRHSSVRHSSVEADLN